jgi:hypothetical protein
LEGGKERRREIKTKKKNKVRAGGKREESRKHTALTGEASSARELRALVRSLCGPVHWA